jgi:hypothetical protein
MDLRVVARGGACSHNGPHPCTMNLTHMGVEWMAKHQGIGLAARIGWLSTMDLTFVDIFDGTHFKPHLGVY